MTAEQKVWNAVLSAFCVVLLLATSARPLARLVAALAGVNWAAVPPGDKLNAVVGVGVGGVGLFVAALGAAIALQQYSLALTEARRKASLSVVAGRSAWDLLNPSHQASVGRWRCELRLRNDGDRPTQDVYWTVFIPFSHNHQVTLTAMAGTIVGNRDEGADEYGEWYKEWSGVTTGPVYENHSIPFARVSYHSPAGIRLPQSHQRCEYRLDCRDGRFPRDGLGQANLSELRSVPESTDVRLGDYYVAPPVDDLEEEK